MEMFRDLTGYWLHGWTNYSFLKIWLGIWVFWKYLWVRGRGSAPTIPLNTPQLKRYLKIQQFSSIPVNSISPLFCTTVPNLFTRWAHEKSISLICRCRAETITILSGCRLRWQYPLQWRYWRPSSTWKFKNQMALLLKRRSHIVDMEL